MDELLDIVNDEDIVIGQELRSKVHQLGLQHRGVHVFLFTSGGKLLIQTRSADRVSAPSLLDGSVSEHVKAGESYLDAAIRGMTEEMNVSGIDLKPRIKFCMQYGVNDNEISMLYEGHVDPTSVKFDPLEIESIQYIEMDKLQKKMQAEPAAFCGWFLEILRAHQGEQTHDLHLLKTY